MILYGGKPVTSDDVEAALMEEVVYFDAHDFASYADPRNSCTDEEQYVLQAVQIPAKYARLLR